MSVFCKDWNQLHYQVSGHEPLYLRCQEENKKQWDLIASFDFLSCRSSTASKFMAKIIERIFIKIESFKKLNANDQKDEKTETQIEENTMN